MTFGEPRCPAEVRELRDRVTDFVRSRIVPCERVLEGGGPDAARTLRRLRREARSEGLWALPLPAELGGRGVPLRSYAHVAEAEGASDHGPAVLGSAPLLDALMLRRHGGDGVRERYLAPLAAGEVRACYAMTAWSRRPYRSARSGLPGA
ncbi:acyl-CoA dehydrogenase family protein, partial [Streptomyces achromogenes]